MYFVFFLQHAFAPIASCSVAAIERICVSTQTVVWPSSLGLECSFQAAPPFFQTVKFPCWGTLNIHSNLWYFQNWLLTKMHRRLLKESISFILLNRKEVILNFQRWGIRRHGVPECVCFALPNCHCCSGGLAVNVPSFVFSFWIYTYYMCYVIMLL